MVEVIEEILGEVGKRSITRLCHFTPSRNFMHIFSGQRGILSSKYLSETEKAIFNPNDFERMDGHPDKICTSIEYPNAYYYRSVKGRDLLFRDWVVLLIDPKYIALKDTHFCAHNAARNRGEFVSAGIDSFKRMYASTVIGSGNRTFMRSKQRFPSCPTDMQAEVLVFDRIEAKDIVGIVFSSTQQAQDEMVRFEYAQVPPPTVPLLVCSAYYDPVQLSKSIEIGVHPKEVNWKPGL